MRPEYSLLTAERVLRAVVPDLAGTPLYLIQPHAHSIVNRERTGGRLGIYFRDLDSVIRPELEEQGKWHGPGVAIIVDAELCFAKARDENDGERKVVGVALHECAHWIDAPTRDDEPQNDPADNWLAAANYEPDAAAIEELGIPLDLVFHDENFSRICCHLWYRARLRGGCPVAPHWLGFGNHYRGLQFLDSPVTYINALQSEFEECDNLPLRQLAQIPAPRAYVELWRAAYSRATEAAQAELSATEHAEHARQ